MKFFSNKIYLQDSPKSFEDLCKEASSKNDEMTKVASAEVGETKEASEAPVAEEPMTAKVSDHSEATDVVEELVEAMSNADADAVAESDDPLKVASIESNEDGTVTVEFSKEADCPCELVDEEAGEEAGEEEEEEMEEEANSYAHDFGKFVKVANLTSNQKDYFKTYWTSVWPEEFIAALLTDQ
jgi:hypothetical protein